MKRIRVRNISWKDYGISVQTQRELKEFYSLREALQDTYLSFMLEQAIESEKTVKTETQPWGF